MQLGFQGSCFAEVYLKDVPSGHYAYDAVYDLIRQGISGGFPDGTYRGDRLMSRYELAAFLAKFSQSRNRATGVDEKLLAEIGSELSLLKYTRDKERQQTRYRAELTGDWRYGATTSAGSGAAARYRLRGGVVRNLSDSSYFKIGLDTLDTGFNNARRDLVTELLVLEGGASWEAANLRVTSGPGEVLHLDSGLFPAENNTYYRLPWRALYFSTAAGPTTFAFDLISRSADPSGQVAVSELSLRLTEDFSPLKLTLKPRFFYGQNGARDIRFELSGTYKVSLAKFGLLAGLAKTAAWPHGLYLRGSLALADCLELVAQRVGGQYREQFNYNIFDLCDRNLADGATSLGWKFQKDIFTDWFVKTAVDYTRPLEVTTTSWGLGRRFGPSAGWELNYQTYNAAYSVGIRAEFRL